MDLKAEELIPVGGGDVVAGYSYGKYVLDSRSLNAFVVKKKCIVT